MECCDADSQISYDNRIKDIKMKYGSLLERLIKEKKDNNNIKIIYSAITEKRLTLKCLTKFEVILERIYNRVKKLPEKSSENVLESSSNDSTIMNLTEVPGACEESSRSNTNKTKQSRWDVQPKDNDLKMQEKNCSRFLSKDEELKLQKKENSEIRAKVYKQLKCNEIAIKKKRDYLQTRGNIQNKNNTSDEVVSFDLTGDDDGDNDEITKETLVPKCKSPVEINKMVRNIKPGNINGETVDNQVTNEMKSGISNGSAMKNKYDNDIEIVASVSGQISVKQERNTITGFASLKEVNRSSIYHKARTDKMMSNCQIAHMKRGTVLDLVDEKETSKLKPRKRPSSPVYSLKNKKAHTSTDNFCNENSIHKNTHFPVKTHPLQTNNLNEANDKEKPLIKTTIDNTTYKNLQSAVRILGLNENDKPLACKESLSNTHMNMNESSKTKVRKSLLPTPVECPNHNLVNSPHIQSSSSVTLPKPINSLCTGHPHCYQNNYLHSYNPERMYERAIQYVQGNQHCSILPKPHPYPRVPAVLWNQDVRNGANNAIYPIEVLTTNASSGISNKNLNGQMFSLENEAVEETNRTSLNSFMNNQSLFPSENKLYYRRSILEDPRLKGARSLTNQSFHQMSERQENTLNSSIKGSGNPNSTFNVFFKRDSSVDTNAKFRYTNRTDNAPNYNSTSRPYHHDYFKKDNPRPSTRNFSHPIETQAESNFIQNKDRYVSPLCNLYKGSEFNFQQPVSNRFNNRQLQTNHKLNTQQPETYNTNKSRQSESQDTINDWQTQTQNTTISRQLETQNTSSRQSELHTINSRQLKMKSRRAIETEFAREKDLKKDKASDRMDKKSDCFTSKISHSQHLEETCSPKIITVKENNTCVCDSSTQELSSSQKSNSDKFHSEVSHNLKQSTVKMRDNASPLSEPEVSSSKVSNVRKQDFSKIKNQLNKTKNKIDLDEDNSSRFKKPQTKGLSLNLDKQTPKNNIATVKKDSKITNMSVKNIARTSEKFACPTKRNSSVKSECVTKIKRRKGHNRIIYYSDSSESSESETINTSEGKSIKHFEDDNSGMTSNKCTTKRKNSKKKCREIMKDNILLKPIAFDKTNTRKINTSSARSEPCEVSTKKQNVEVTAINLPEKKGEKTKKKGDCKVSNKVGINENKIMSDEDKDTHQRVSNNSTNQEKQNETPSCDVSKQLLEKVSFLLKNPEAIKTFCELASLFGHLKPDHESSKELDLIQSIQNVLGTSNNQHARKEIVNFIDEHSVLSKDLTSIHSVTLVNGPEAKKEEKSENQSMGYVEKSQINEATPSSKIYYTVPKESVADNFNASDSTGGIKANVLVCGKKTNNGIVDDTQLPLISNCQNITETSYILHESSVNKNKPIILNTPCVRCNSVSKDILSDKATNSDEKICSSDETKEKKDTANKPGNVPNAYEVSSIEPNSKKLASTESRVKCKRAKKRISELEKIQASLQSLPDYDNLMNYTGLRSCRIKNNLISSPPKTTGRAKKRTYKRKNCASLDFSSERSSGYIPPLSSFNSNKEGLSKILDLSFEGTMSKPASPSSPPTSTLEDGKESQDLQNNCIETSNIEIVDVFSLSEKKYIKSGSQDEYVTIVKEFLSDYERELEPRQILAESSTFAENIVLDKEDGVSKKNTDINRDVGEHEPESVVLRGADEDEDHVGWKDPTVYQLMLTVDKLTHFYKCMHRDCSFTDHTQAEFAEHLNFHCKINKFSRPIQNDWRLCAYCPYMERCGNVENYLEHLHHDHGNCTVQCRYCFYRGPSFPAVLSHQSEKHPGQVQNLLQCQGVQAHGCSL